MDDELLAAVEREVLLWPGTTSEPGRFNAVSFRYGKREIGHVHRDRIADLPVTLEVREELLAKGRARPHRAGSRGYISYPMEDAEDVSAVLEILGRNYDRAKAAAARRAASQGEKAGA
ncbi:MAG TPA: luciferase family protein [Rubrobacter sp.]|nr:luciferase family protein [Rubrobacter sp.]